MKAAHNPLRKRFLMRGLPLITAMMFLGCAQSVIGQWASPSPNPNNNIYYNSGNVGIGTTSPSYPLDVTGASLRVRMYPSTGTQDVKIHQSNTGGDFFIGIDSSTASFFGNGNYATSLYSNINAPMNFYTNGAHRMQIAAGGNVGIGTTNPSQKLHVKDGVLQVERTGINGAGAAVLATLDTDGKTAGDEILQWFRGKDDASNVTVYGSLSSVILDPTNGSEDSYFKFNTYRAGTTADVMVVGYNGNVGIGTTSPAVKLHISKSYEGFRLAGGDDTSPTWMQFNTSAGSGMGYFGVEGSTGGTFFSGTLPYATALSSGASGTALQLGAAGAVRMTLTSSGNVGIGTTSPQFKLDINGNMSVGDSNGASAKQLQVAYDTGNDRGVIQAVHQGTAYTNLLLNPSGGNVGIGTGTTNPGYKLDVNGNTNVQGNITASGSIAAKYQDVAEWVLSSEQLAAGTVVVLDSTKSNQVISSNQSYDTRVAGVISAQPGIALGEKGDSKVLVATTGRVKVKVDASKGPIHIGDLLVTSDVPGVAMRSEPVEFAGRKMHMPGTLIGKALEPLEKGHGEILVLLSLQ